MVRVEKRRKLLVVSLRTIVGFYFNKIFLFISERRLLPFFFSVVSLSKQTFGRTLQRYHFSHRLLRLASTNIISKFTHGQINKSLVKTISETLSLSSIYRPIAQPSFTTMLCVKHDVVVTILLLSWENLSRIKSIFSSSMISSYHTAASRWTHSARKRWAVILLCVFCLLSVTFQVCAHHSVQMTCIQAHAVFSFPELTLQSSFTCTHARTHTHTSFLFFLHLINRK